ncbi:copper chaperone PCu(A)C [Asticcacaulis tiandongensis]|uniref:copper chaperone PCu(A)C n=1 Tax=Asticcacaulis tiandongensis TaxID=2565365 RepID=UPI00112E1A13|nr:copper chaperone PCu(A)C [Asticcacaulis tiandongensis]
MRGLILLAAAGLALTACEAKKPVGHESEHADAADSITLQNLSFSHLAIRAALGENPNTAAYVVIENPTAGDDRLLSAQAGWADKTELHTMETVDGVMKMAAAPEGFVIKAGETLELKPGGNHIMLMGLKERPQEGEMREIILTFEKAGQVPLTLPVTTTPQAAGGQGHGHDH